MNDTRERILAVAQDLFIKQGYDKVSLREVAEQVGVTKAALYYHFASKEELLKTLVQPLQAATGQFLEMLDAGPSRQAWAANWSRLIDWIFENRTLFRLLETNRATFQAFGDDWMGAEVHDSVHSRFEALLTDQSVSLEDKARIGASFGAVAGVLGLSGGDTLADGEVDHLKSILLDIIGDVLQVHVREGNVPEGDTLEGVASAGEER